MSGVDCCINVYRRPLQTALTLVSLFAHSARHIDRLYFIQEPGDETDFSFLDELVPVRVVRHRPRYFFGVNPVALEDAADEDYRLSIRYQYAWEHSDKDLLFLCHNDVWFRDDVVGLMLDALGSHVAVGPFGQCGCCPAMGDGKCGPGRYLDFRPDLAELLRLQGEVRAPNGQIPKPYHLPRLSREFRLRPWPLPECRCCEFAILVNLKVARKATMPLGPARPFGAFIPCGSAVLDTGGGWFRDVTHMGLTCGHFPLNRHAVHGMLGPGHPSYADAEAYRTKEERAREILRDEYGVRM